MLSVKTSIVLFIDGPNVDATFGKNVLGRKPKSHERCRWDRFLELARKKFGVTCARFVLNGDRFDDKSASFFRALRTFGFVVETPKSVNRGYEDASDPVDNSILEGIHGLPKSSHGADVNGVMLVSHDGGYAQSLLDVIEAERIVYIVGFREWLAPELVGLEYYGARILDLEHEFGAFNVSLDRPRFAA